ncbi:MAG TPA: hypothetical protein VLH84_02125 [Patescibacteria group bacterium]|nr:hypothetical protein [Patescibacteria group bacterium]
MKLEGSHPLVDRARTAVAAAGLAIQVARDNWENPGWTAATDGSGFGMMAQAIIGANLIMPDQAPDGTAELVKRVAGPGRHYGFDFERRFWSMYDDANPKPSPMWEGYLMFWLPKGIVHRKPHELSTPSLRWFMSPAAHATYRRATEQDLLDHGLARATTYGEAYDILGTNRYDAHRERMAALKRLDDPVLQITPKGNGLVYLSRRGDSGTTRVLEFGSGGGMRGARRLWEPVRA